MENIKLDGFPPLILKNEIRDKNKNKGLSPQYAPSMLLNINIRQIINNKNEEIIQNSEDKLFEADFI